MRFLFFTYVNQAWYDAGMGIEEYKKKFPEVFKRYNVVVAYLFGSAAQKSVGPMSDVDVAVTFRKYEPDVSARMKQESALGGDLEAITGRTVDLVNLNEVRSPLLLHRIVRRGVLLYCTDGIRRQELERRSLYEFEDTRHLRAVQLRAMRNHIREGTFGRIS